MSLFIIMLKEIVDNLRDRQTVFYALLFGPVLLPLLLGGSLVASFKQLSIDFDQVTTLSVANADKAPTLVEFYTAITSMLSMRQRIYRLAFARAKHSLS